VSLDDGVGVAFETIGVSVGGTAVGVAAGVGVSVGVLVGVLVGVSVAVGVAVAVGAGVFVTATVGVAVAVGDAVEVGVEVGVDTIPRPESATDRPSIVRLPLAVVPPVGENATPMLHEPFAGTELHPATALKTGSEVERTGSGRSDALLLMTCMD
jgi:hypothetical protein